jgi:hypothetical protein
MRAVLRKAVRVLAAAGEMLGDKYEMQKDRFLFLPHRNFRRFSRRSSGEKLQNRAVAENRRGGRNRENRSFHALASPNMPPYGRPLCNNHAAADPENRPRSPTPLHKPTIELIHA